MYEFSAYATCLYHPPNKYTNADKVLRIIIVVVVVIISHLIRINEMKYRELLIYVY